MSRLLHKANYGVCLSVLVKAKCALCDGSVARYADAGREPCEIRAACVYARTTPFAPSSAAHEVDG